MSCFAGGLFLAMAFMHILPEAVEKSYGAMTGAEDAHAWHRMVSTYDQTSIEPLSATSRHLSFRARLSRTPPSSLISSRPLEISLVSFMFTPVMLPRVCTSRLKSSGTQAWTESLPDMLGEVSDKVSSLDDWPCENTYSEVVRVATSSSYWEMYFSRSSNIKFACPLFEIYSLALYPGSPSLPSVSL